MTFLCTYNGKLEPGYLETGGPNGAKYTRIKVVNGVEFYDWPDPWAFRCDFCKRVFPYGCVIYRGRTPLRPPGMRQLDGYDVHRCAYCEGWRDPGQQLNLFEP